MALKPLTNKQMQSFYLMDKKRQFAEFPSGIPNNLLNREDKMNINGVEQLYYYIKKFESDIMNNGRKLDINKSEMILSRINSDLQDIYNVFKTIIDNDSTKGMSLIGMLYNVIQNRDLFLFLSSNNMISQPFNKLADFVNMLSPNKVNQNIRLNIAKALQKRQNINIQPMAQQIAQQNMPMNIQPPAFPQRQQMPKQKDVHFNPLQFLDYVTQGLQNQERQQALIQHREEERVNQLQQQQIMGQMANLSRHHGIDTSPAIDTFSELIGHLPRPNPKPMSRPIYDSDEDMEDVPESHVNIQQQAIPERVSYLEEVFRMPEQRNLGVRQYETLEQAQRREIAQNKQMLREIELRNNPQYLSLGNISDKPLIKKLEKKQKQLSKQREIEEERIFLNRMEEVGEVDPELERMSHLKPETFQRAVKARTATKRNTPQVKAPKEIKPNVVTLSPSTEFTMTSRTKVAKGKSNVITSKSNKKIVYI